MHMARHEREHQFLSMYDHADEPNTRPSPDRGLASRSVSRYFFFKEMAGKIRSDIEPAMRKICRDLHKQGYRAAIFQEIEAAMVDDNIRPAHISLAVFTETGKPAYDLSRYPHIAFVASSQKNMIWVRKKLAEVHGGQELNAGEYKISAITRQLVEKHIRDFLPEVLCENLIGQQAGKT